MKRIVSVFALGIAFIAGSQAVQAQDAAREAAKEKVAKLDKMLELDQKQEEIIYRVYVAYEINSSPEKLSEGDKEAVRQNMMKNEFSLMKTMKETLSPDQFDKYQKFRMENMTKEEKEIMEMMKKEHRSKSLKAAPARK
ncbi:MAG TPA: hypothetical protein VFM82_10110 [Flavobacteriaceae bacterium]|nr:hypothetical protein [Flavobacteriaceae bacterium]